MKFILVISLIFYTLTGWAVEVTVKGVVIDSTTKDPLAFVHVFNLKSKTGTTTDINGTFSIKAEKLPVTLRLSYVGYKTIQYVVTQEQVLIYLPTLKIDLKEVEVLPGENPAHRIILQAIQNKEHHDPENTPYSCYTYNKFYYTAAPEYFLKGDSTISKMDSAELSYYHFLEKHHLFLMEFVTKKFWQGENKSKEIVIGSRVSGLKEPSFTVLATDFQPFGFYDDLINLYGKTYLNPISKGSIKKYLFLLKDTLYDQGDSVFVISYQPRKGKNFESLQGVISIHTDGYAIQNIIAEPWYEELNRIKVQQQYERVEGRWFPQQLNTELVFKELDLMLSGKTYIQKAALHIPDSVRFDNTVLETTESAALKKEDFWRKYREPLLAEKDSSTYTYIDSIGEAINLDKKVSSFDALIDNQWPLGFVNLDLSRIYDYNNYEGSRVGLGLITNKKVSRVFFLGGYGAYGFADEKWKYGGSLKLKPWERKYFHLNFSYSNDLLEPGIPDYFEENTVGASESYRKYFIGIKEKDILYRGAMAFKTFQYFYWELYGEYHNERILSDYHIMIQGDESAYADRSFDIVETGLRLKFAYGEKLAKTTTRAYSLGSQYPVVWLNLGKGINAFGTGDFDYLKLNARIKYSFKAKGLGKFKIIADAGLTDAEIPYTHLFYGYGSYSNGFSVVAENTFQTMRLYEFLSNRFASINVQYNMGKVFFKNDHIRPEFVLHHATGYGNLQNETFHHGIDFKTMEKGYHESGIAVRDIYRINYMNIGYLGFGAGCFYRYGPYAFEDINSNIAVKFVFRLSL